MSKKKEEKSAENTQPQQKKVKVVYYDDGSTVADMSGTRRNKNADKSTRKERMRTFLGVAKKMVIPMLATLAVFTLVYIILLKLAGQL